MKVYIKIDMLDKITYVVKRKGNLEEINFDKIHKRIKYLILEPYVLENVDSFILAQNVIQKLNNNILTSKIDTYTADLSASLSMIHRDYLILAGRISINNHHKNTLNSFSDKIELLYMRKVNGKICPLLSDNFYKYVKKNAKKIDKYINYSRDYDFDYFSFGTLNSSYLLKVDGNVVERPQDMFMRVAIQIHMPLDIAGYDDSKYLSNIFRVYDNLTYKYYTHATPTLFNAGSPLGNFSSCFLLGTEDSREGIMKTLDDCTKISKHSGGIGVHISNWRPEGSLIRGTNGLSNGIVPFLRLFNDAARAFNQGGKRKGSFAIYIEPHHPDIMKFLDLRKNVGDENERCRDLFTAIWVSDLFMDRVKNNAEWSMFCPDKCPGLNDCYGEEYKLLYEKYEKNNMTHSTINARLIWEAIYMSQTDSGIPYISYKDNVNKCNMQSNIGIIKSSNLCNEINLYSDSKEYSVCNLSSICLPKFVKDTYDEQELLVPEQERRKLDHEFPTHAVLDYVLLAKIAGEITENLNNIIDKNWNPVIETARSNFNHRPIGIGIQGLADVFLKFRVSFDSDEAKILNKRIFEAIYYGAMSASTKLSKDIYKDIMSNFGETNVYNHNLYPEHVVKDLISMTLQKLHFDDENIKYTIVESIETENLLGSYTNSKDIPKTIGTYPSYHRNGGSPLSKGNFHWQLFGLKETELSGMFDWTTLREHIKIYGVRNSVVCAAMPTASTSQIMGCSSCFEPYISNTYKRTTIAGEYVVINKYLLKDLQNLNLWSETLRNHIILNNGSIQRIEGIPDYIKNLYKTVWEIKQKDIIDMARDRQPFIDQSQSMNLFMEDFKFNKFNKLQFYAWKSGLKTGSYYVRTRAATKGEFFTIDPKLQKELEMKVLIESSSAKKILNIEEEEICMLCSS